MAKLEVFKAKTTAVANIKDIINSIEKYNPANKAALEEYVQSQSADESYDLEAYLSLLQLYKFYPKMVNNDISYMILLKCLSQIQRADFSIAKALLLPQQLNDLTVKVIFHMSEYLESADFPAFWKLAYEIPAMFVNVKGFFDAIRRHICVLVGLTFKKINKSTLNLLLGNIDDAELIIWIKKNNWKLVDNMVEMNAATQNENEVVLNDIGLDDVITLLTHIE
ncbi:eukaryotic translation initiation factor 3 subunit K-like [Teleopsis dalmanni]|uniref:eukaryotic translation initiation factor 3 subunit K-like n=1 Tax=Teleopsis dalmanni TaxID=139649 RepID=UPI0018CFA84B|nr:eukaryotic translation initiation factor 3 subunit K-like [Teleopsis dalmanni]